MHKYDKPCCNIFKNSICDELGGRCIPPKKNILTPNDTLGVSHGEEELSIQPYSFPMSDNKL